MTVKSNLRASAVSAGVFVISVATAVGVGSSTSSPVVPFDDGSGTPAIAIAATALYCGMALSLLALGWFLGRSWSVAIGGSSLPTLSTLSGAVALCSFLTMVVIFGEASNHEATSSAADELWTLLVISTAMLSAAVSLVSGLLALRRGVRPSSRIQPH